MNDQEIKEYFSYFTSEELQKAYQTILEIKNKCEDYTLSKPLKIPNLKWKAQAPIADFELQNYIRLIPELKNFVTSKSNADNYLVKAIINGIKKHEDLQNEEAYEAINECLNMTWVSSQVNKAEWSAYFLNLQQILEICWSAGTLVGPARGSGAGFILLYVLDITQINPLREKTKTQPWRFLNPERVSVLDIDVDISSAKREQVLNALRKFYGEDRVSNVATFGTEKAKSAIQTTCFREGTLVETKNGEIPIELIQSGDLVKTLNGYEPVIFPTVYQGIPNYKIKTKNSLNKEFYCTADHEILTIEAYRRVSGESCTSLVKEIFPELNSLSSLDNVYEKYMRNIKKVNPIWKPASQIHNKYDFGLTLIDTTIKNIKSIHWTNDFRQKFGIGISENVNINEDFCELIGIWIAEGSINKANNTVAFTIHQDEEFLKLRIIQLMWKVFQLDNVCITTRLDSKAITIAYSSSQLAQFFFELFDNTGIWREKRTDNTYHYLTQWDKKVPNILMNIDPYLQLQIIKGWFLGDGYARSKEQNGSQMMKCTTVSKQLAKDMLVLFHRNFINPSVDVEQRSLTRSNECDCYNLSLYGDYGNFFYNIKYTTQENYNTPIRLPLDIRRKDDLPVIYKNKLYMKTKLEASVDFTINERQKVYCLKMPNGNFSVNNTIVHNCRGLGIDNDTALYIASLIPSDRGQVRTLKQCYYGDEENGFSPVSLFVKEMNNNPKLWAVAQKIEGLCCRMGEHAGGVIFVDEDFTNSVALMRAPNGDIVTQYDLHDCEKNSLIKIDLLSIEALDKIQCCLELLVADGYIDKNLSLREQYEQTIGIYNLEREAPEMWKMVWDHKIQSLFQMEKQSGIKGIEIIKPKSVDELAVLNSVIRLMAQDKDSKQPLEIWAENRKDINNWIKEMKSYGLTSEEIDWLRHHEAITDGICESQEGLMSLVQEPLLGGNNLSFADRCRKGIAKKQGKLFQECEEEFYNNIKEKQLSQKLAHYVWDVLLRVQRGYSFNRSHCLAYSLVGLQEMNLCYKFPIVYWDCACLITNSGGTTNGTDYDKVAIAINKAKEAGTTIKLPDINHSDYGFKPDVKNNQIVCGLKSLVNIGDELVHIIINNRNYQSIKDFYERIKPNKQAMISLIMAGAFDDLLDRTEAMTWFISETCGKKKNINLQNMKSILNYKILPQTEYCQRAIRFYEFNRYLKAICADKKSEYFNLDNRALAFLEEMGLDGLTFQKDNIFYIDKKQWDKKVYQKEMDVIRLYLQKHQEEVKEKINQNIFMEEWNKYALGTLSTWEMNSLCFYQHPHELINVDREKYGLQNFKELPTEPVVEREFKRGTQVIKLFKLTKICGTVIAKDKNHGLLTLLEPDGNVVTVRLGKERFAIYDKQISVKDATGKKTVLEKSWLQRGNLLMLQGMRSGDEFVAKKYASTSGHTLYKIVKIEDNGELILLGERKQGD